MRVLATGSAHSARSIVVKKNGGVGMEWRERVREEAAVEEYVIGRGGSGGIAGGGVRGYGSELEVVPVVGA